MWCRRPAVWRHRCQQERQYLEDLFANFWANSVFERLGEINLVGQLHDLGDGGIEVPALLEVLCDAQQRLVRDSDQVAFFVGHSLSVEVAVLGVADCRGVLVYQAEDAVQETYLRWHRTDRARVNDPRAFLSRIVTRTVPIDDWTSALTKGHDDVKVVIDLQN